VLVTTLGGVHSSSLGEPQEKKVRTITLNTNATTNKMARSKSSTKTAAEPATPAKKTAKPSETKTKPTKTSINVDKKLAESEIPRTVVKKTRHKEKQEKDVAPPVPTPATVSPYQLDKEQVI
jgi:hypothetical protein